MFGIWTEMWIDGHSVPDYVTHAVTEGGQLAAAYVRPFLMDDPAAVTLDPGNDVFYKAAPPAWVDSTDFEGLTAHVVGADGQLDQMGRSDLCGGGGTQVGDVVPLFALRGVVFARADAAGQPVVCSWQGARLAPGAGLGDTGLLGTGFAPGEATSPALLAFASYVFGSAPAYAVRGKIQLLSLGTGTDVALLDLVELPASVRQLLRTYAVGAESRLELVQELAGTATGWQRGYHPLSMAVSVRAGTPRL